MTTEALTEQAFERAADQSLRALETALTEVAGLEAELASGILSIEFPDGGKFIINSHRAARQIWMAAGSTAWHFDLHPENGKWIAAKTGDELWAAIEAAVSRKLGEAVKLAG